MLKPRKGVIRSLVYCYRDVSDSQKDSSSNISGDVVDDTVCHDDDNDISGYGAAKVASTKSP